MLAEDRATWFGAIDNHCIDNYTHGAKVVSELIMALTMPQLFLLYEVFLRRFNGELKRPESWTRVLLMFIAKITALQKLVNFIAFLLR